MTVKKTTRKTRVPKYKTAEGDYLVIEENRDDFRIAWFSKEWEDVGGHVGEDAPGPTPPKDKGAWEIWQAARSIKDLADGRDSDGYYFESIAKARLALATANAALFSGEAPWPAWALQAKEAGWTPPKGWKP
jgi:hypothetical protein